MNKVLVILGPTATGKTDLALSLAKKLGGELVACDSRQVYRGLDIGTGKMPSNNSKFKSQNSKLQFKIQKFKNYWEIGGVKVWMYDVADPEIRYTVKDYVEQASRVVEDILQRGKLPIIVGGTGLYLKALLDGLPNLAIPVDEKLRRELEGLSLRELQEKLKLLSPARFRKLNNSDRQNKRRLLRSIELVSMYGYMKTQNKKEALSDKYQVLKIGLTAPRDILKKRIFSRLISRIDQGLVKEAEKLRRSGLTLLRMKELGLEYGMLAKLLSGEIDKNQFIDQLAVKISRYAKRQMTWFKKEKDVFWFDITDKRWQDQVEKVVDIWYHAAT